MRGILEAGVVAVKNTKTWKSGLVAEVVVKNLEAARMNEILPAAYPNDHAGAPQTPVSLFVYFQDLSGG